MKNKSSLRANEGKFQNHSKRLIYQRRTRKRHETFLRTRQHHNIRNKPKEEMAAAKTRTSAGKRCSLLNQNIKNSNRTIFFDTILSLLIPSGVRFGLPWLRSNLIAQIQPIEIPSKQLMHDRQLNDEQIAQLTAISCDSSVLKS